MKEPGGGKCTDHGTGKRWGLLGEKGGEDPGNGINESRSISQGYLPDWTEETQRWGTQKKKRKPLDRERHVFFTIIEL